MDALRTRVFVLYVLLVPVSCEVVALAEPVICYILDGILIVYCITVTALYFREKFSQTVAIAEPEDAGRIYQELRRPADADPYQVLEPTKRKKPGKKRKPQPRAAEGQDRNTPESPSVGAAAPPLPPH